jgi:hypothetical protein
MLQMHAEYTNSLAADVLLAFDRSKSGSLPEVASSHAIRCSYSMSVLFENELFQARV